MRINLVDDMKIRASHSSLEVVYYGLAVGCVAYSISSAAEIRDRALSFFQGSGIHEVVSHCLPYQWLFCIITSGVVA